MREFYKYIVVSCAVLLIGCGGKGPQRPSQRRGEAPKADSTQLALLEWNQHMSQAADEQLFHLVQAQAENYAQYERGTWVHLWDKGDTDNPVREGEECTVHLRVMSLEGQLFHDTQRTARVGKYELPPAIDANIGEWYHGTRARLYAPWYAAYGIQGTKEVPPYENVIIELEIK